jgi:hypothetical protein
MSVHGAQTDVHDAQANDSSGQMSVHRRQTSVHVPDVNVPSCHANVRVAFVRLRSGHARSHTVQIIVDLNDVEFRVSDMNAGLA